MKKTVSLLLSMVIFITVLGPLGGTAPVYAQDGEGALPESMYLQPPVGECSGCGEPVFAREGRWAEDSRCYTCWAIDRNKHSLVTWTPPVHIAPTATSPPWETLRDFATTALKRPAVNIPRRCWYKTRKRGNRWRVRW